MADITLEGLRHYSKVSATMVTADAPLFGVVMVLHGQIVSRGDSETKNIGTSIGFPPREQIVAAAPRFWIQQDNGLRQMKTRDEMTKLLREYQRAAGAS